MNRINAISRYVVFSNLTESSLITSLTFRHAASCLRSFEQKRRQEPGNSGGPDSLSLHRYSRLTSPPSDSAGLPLRKAKTLSSATGMNSATHTRQNINMKIVLASESEFRRRALDMLGLTYEICAIRIDEKAIRDSDSAALSQKLEQEKAPSVAENYWDQEVVIISGDAVAAKTASFLKNHATTPTRRCF